MAMSHDLLRGDKIGANNSGVEAYLKNKNARTGLKPPIKPPFQRSPIIGRNQLAPSESNPTVNSPAENNA